MTKRCLAYGEVVWSWRRDAGAKSVGVIPLMTVANKPVHRGEHVISRKAIAQGMSVCSPLTCMLVCIFFNAQAAHETAGAARTRHSLRPLLRERDNEFGNLGQFVPREYSRSSVRGGRSESPESITTARCCFEESRQTSLETNRCAYGFRARAKRRVPE